MEMKHVGIMKYLVKEKGVSVHEVKDLSLVLGALESMIRAFPEDVEDDALEKEVGERKKEKRNKVKSSPKAPLAGKSHRNPAASSKHNNLQHPHSSVVCTSKDKTLLPRDNKMQSAPNAGLYGNIGRYDSDDEKNCIPVDSEDDCSVCTTVEEKVSPSKMKK